MSLETIIDFPCRVKQELGQGDLRAGTTILLDKLSVRHRVEQVRATTRPDELIVNMPVKIVRVIEGAPVEQQTTLGQLELEATTLDPHVPVCTNCPVNALRAPFGCVVVVRYPLRRSGEQWLLDRVQPPDTIGGALCLQSLEDARISGERTRDHRTRGHLEAFPGLSRELPGHTAGKTTLTGDELLETILLARGKLHPWQSLNILLWLGAIKFDSHHPQTANDALKLTALAPAERARQAKLHLGRLETDPGVADIQNLLKALFVCWVRDVVLLVDAG